MGRGIQRTEHLDRHRRHRRRVLPPRRRPGRDSVQDRARHAGDGRSHRRLGRQPEADRHRQALHRLHDGRRGPRCVQGRGQVQGPQGPAAHADGAVPEPDACRLHRRPRDQQDRRPQGQAHLDRLAGQCDRSDGFPHSRSRGHRQGQGRQAGTAGGRRIRERDQGQQDRRLFLGRRLADSRCHGPGQYARHQNQNDRSRRPGPKDEQEVRRPVRGGHDPQSSLPGHGDRQPAGHCDEPAGDARQHGRQDGLQHRQDHLRQAHRPDRGAQGG